MKQQYENYWKLTLEYSDIHGVRFRQTLLTIVDFIKKKEGRYSSAIYKELQEILQNKFRKADKASIRKSINQFIKLGFISTKLAGYVIECDEFLKTSSKRKRNAIFSRVLYKYSSFNRSVTNNSEEREINFLIKTLEENEQLTRDQVAALMTVVVADYKKGYLEKKQLNQICKKVKKSKFAKRKYNQINYFWNILKKLEQLKIYKDKICFEEDSVEIFGIELEPDVKKRDNYLHLLYKTQLKYETVGEKNFRRPKCMVEGMDYPVLIASHIKPFVSSNEEEAYDPNNGLLLSKNMDGLFDGGYISFDNKGKIMLSKRLSKAMIKHLIQFSLNTKFINDKRIEYLKFHRINVFQKEDK